MRWGIKKKQDMHAWHGWFAWKPVTVDDERIWLEKIFRRTDGYLTATGKPDWEYAADEFAVLASIENDREKMKEIAHNVAAARANSAKKAPMFSIYPRLYQIIAF